MVQTSPDPLRYDFVIPSNADYRRRWSFTDKETGDSVLEAGCTLHMEIKKEQTEEGTPILALEIVALTSPPVSGFQMDIMTGNVDVLIKNADIPDDIYEEGQTKVKLRYDFLVTYSDNVSIKYVEGKITVPRGVTGDA